MSSGQNSGGQVIVTLVSGDRIDLFEKN